jgi:hypothetical protein
MDLSYFFIEISKYVTCLKKRGDRMNDKVDKDVSVSKYNHTKKPIITKKNLEILRKKIGLKQIRHLKKTVTQIYSILSLGIVEEDEVASQIE